MREILSVELREQGLTYAEIARAVGYNDRAAAHKAVKRVEARREKDRADFEEAFAS